MNDRWWLEDGTHKHPWLWVAGGTLVIIVLSPLLLISGIVGTWNNWTPR